MARVHRLDSSFGHGHARQPVVLECVVDPVAPSVSNHVILFSRLLGRVPHEGEGLVRDLVEDHANGARGQRIAQHVGVDAGWGIVEELSASIVDVEQGHVCLGSHQGGDADLQPMRPDLFAVLHFSCSEPFLEEV